MSRDRQIEQARARVEKGGADKYHQKNAESGKLFARERIRRLIAEGSSVEHGASPNTLPPARPATGVGRGPPPVGGRPHATMANPPTVRGGQGAPGPAGKPR